jgi:hypothetical protein
MWSPRTFLYNVTCSRIENAWLFSSTKPQISRIPRSYHCSSSPALWLRLPPLRLRFLCRVRRVLSPAASLRAKPLLKSFSSVSRRRLTAACGTTSVFFSPVIKPSRRGASDGRSSANLLPNLSARVQENAETLSLTALGLKDNVSPLGPSSSRDPSLQLLRRAGFSVSQSLFNFQRPREGTRRLREPEISAIHLQGRA